MHVECSIEKLKGAIGRADRITGKNLALPVLGSILIIASGKSLKLRATNLNLGIEIEIPATVTKEGVVAIKGEVMSHFLATLPGAKTITISLEGDTLLCVSKNNTARIKTIAHEDFPTIPVVEGVHHHIAAKKYIEGVKAVYYSCSLSEIKPEIASVYIYADEGMLVFVATDSFRLAEKKIKTSLDTEFPSMLIPFKNIVEIVRVFEEVGDDLILTINKNQVSFSSGGIYITSRIIDAVFPDYKQIIPKEATTTAVVLKEDFMNALKVTTIFSDKFNQVTFTLSPKAKEFSLSSKNIEVGENNTTLEGTLEGEPITISFNVRYIVDCFQSITHDSLILSFNGANKPLVIKGGSDPSFRYLIMPMNR